MRYYKPRATKENYVIITPRNDNATKKLEWHGTKWVMRQLVEEVKFSRDPGPWYVLISRDGKKSMFVRQTGDVDFDVRTME